MNSPSASDSSTGPPDSPASAGPSVTGAFIFAHGLFAATALLLTLMATIGA